MRAFFFLAWRLKIYYFPSLRKEGPSRRTLALILDHLFALLSSAKKSWNRKSMAMSIILVSSVILAMQS